MHGKAPTECPATGLEKKGGGKRREKKLRARRQWEKSPTCRDHRNQDTGLGEKGPEAYEGKKKEKRGEGV